MLAKNYLQKTYLYIFFFLCKKLKPQTMAGFDITTLNSTGRDDTTTLTTPPGHVQFILFILQQRSSESPSKSVERYRPVDTEVLLNLQVSI
jgi:hypothetical protein